MDLSLSKKWKFRRENNKKNMKRTGFVLFGDDFTDGSMLFISLAAAAAFAESAKRLK